MEERIIKEVLKEDCIVLKAKEYDSGVSGLLLQSKTLNEPANRYSL